MTAFDILSALYVEQLRCKGPVVTAKQTIRCALDTVDCDRDRNLFLAVVATSRSALNAQFTTNGMCA